jgi:hypothetical protein
MRECSRINNKQMAVLSTLGPINTSNLATSLRKANEEFITQYVKDNPWDLNNLFPSADQKPVR